MVSLMVLVIGMLGLMKVASVAVQSNQRGARMDQAIIRAQQRLEALREVPTATLACLAAGSAPSTCLATCQTAGGEQHACQTALAQDPEAAQDSTGTAYSYGFLVTQPTSGVYDILVVASYEDTSSKPARTVRAFFRTAIYW
jgi:Tfp pilus assembly protein PilV